MVKCILTGRFEKRCFLNIVYTELSFGYQCITYVVWNVALTNTIESLNICTFSLNRDNGVNLCHSLTDMYAKLYSKQYCLINDLLFIGSYTFKYSSTLSM